MQPMRNNRTVDVPTIAALGAIAGFLMLVTHEVLGHSLTTILLGAHFVRATAIDSSYAGQASPSAMRVIASAGIVAQLVAGSVVLWAAHTLPARWCRIRYLAWLYGHATLFMGSSYLAAFAFLPFGDVHAAVAGLPLQTALQIALLVTGIAIYLASLRSAERTLGRWACTGNPATATTLTVTPYLAMGITATAAGLLHPDGPLNGALWAAAATFGASAGFLRAADSVRNALASGSVRNDDGAGSTRNDAAANCEPLRIARSNAWIMAGVVATLALVGVLGPGIPR